MKYKCRRCDGPISDSGWCRECWSWLIWQPEYELWVQFTHRREYELADKVMDEFLDKKINHAI